MPVAEVIQTIQNQQIQFIDLRFTDTRGKDQHMTVSAETIDEDFFVNGKMFDGSSIAGWKGISDSDMVLRPDVTTAMIDPFYKQTTLVLRCDVLEPSTMKGYERDPRSIARKAEAYLRESGIADICYFGPEPEFFLLEDVSWKIDMNQVFFNVDDREAPWNTETVYEGGNRGHRPSSKGGYFPVPPVDHGQDLRSAICLVLQELGMNVETQHHEVAACQHEINTRFGTLLKKADDTQILKYVVHNVAQQFGKTATFMPKPFFGDNGSGMHCHQSLEKNGENLFAGELYSGLSEMALYYVGGIIKHARALNAFTNPSTNSYKRLVPGFEAPVSLAYSARNRSAAIRIPHVSTPKARRIEVRFPDGTANPYLAFSAMLMAGIDGIQRKIHPGEAMDRDLYGYSEAQLIGMPTVARDLAEALKCLRDDSDFLLAGGVFSEDFVQSYIDLKLQDVQRLRMTTHPVEFDMYYSS